MIDIPKPDPDFLIHSEKLAQLIKQEITQNNGTIPFARFMELALYSPGLGYYSAGMQKFGAGGDFVTAPEISPLFARCLARQCQQVLGTMHPGERCILELGAGSGILAVELLLELERLQCLPQQYLILEVSADLRERQQTFLKAQIPHLLARIKWLDILPNEPINGIIIANEVMDAMPVHRFQWSNHQLQEFYVTCNLNCLADSAVFSYQHKLVSESDEIYKAWMPAFAGMTQRAEQLPTSYISEINLLLPAWISSLSHCLQKGLLLLIDYGFPRHEYYHPDRSMGTLMCHYRHRAHPDPLILVGLQDITAHVDFTLVAESAAAAGLEVTGFTNQATFLLGCGLLELAAGHNSDIKEQLKTSQQIQVLTSPAEMGELFKVIALTRGLEDIDLLGFKIRDQRGRL